MTTITSKPKSVAVICTKANGMDIVFCVSPDRATADRVVAQLARVGCVARTSPAMPSDVPSVTRRVREV